MTIRKFQIDSSKLCLWNENIMQGNTENLNDSGKREWDFFIIFFILDEEWVILNVYVLCYIRKNNWNNGNELCLELSFCGRRKNWKRLAKKEIKLSDSNIILERTLYAASDVERNWDMVYLALEGRCKIKKWISKLGEM